MMIEIYQILVQETENGFVVILYQWNREKDETKSVEKHVFQNQGNPAETVSGMKLAKNKAFQFAKEQLDSKRDEINIETQRFQETIQKTEEIIPVRKVKGGHRWGKHGKVYPTKVQAARQGRAIKARQAEKGKKKG